MQSLSSSKHCLCAQQEIGCASANAQIARNHQARRDQLQLEIKRLVGKIREARENAELRAPRTTNHAFRQARDAFRDAKSRHQSAEAEYKHLKAERNKCKEEVDLLNIEI